jgi:ABC-type polysaccharide/polyol phosphate transport system ATPase subunit
MGTGIRGEHIVKMQNIALSVQNVSKRFSRGEMHDSLRDFIPSLFARLTGRARAGSAARNEFWALQDVSFELNRGEAFGIIGSNGAGKSTILKLITGIMQPTTGSIELNGRLSALIEVGAGFHPDLTGRENIYLNGTILGMRRVEIDRKFEAIVEFSGLADFIDTPVKRYSTGMYARLGFSVAAHVDPDILIVDEVLSVGDIVFQNRCLEKMNDIIRSGATVIFVSHNLRAIAELCPRSILLEHGKVTAIGPSQQVLKSYLENSGQEGRRARSKELAITAVKVRGSHAEGVAFNSGEKVSVDVEVECIGEGEPFSVVLFVNDDRQYEAFHTSTEYLGYPAISMKPGERFACTFEIDLILAGGTFYFGVLLYRFNIEKIVDRVFPAATIFVNTLPEVRGIINPHPMISAFGPVAEIGSAKESIKQ